MSKRFVFILSMLALLFVANILMVLGFTNYNNYLGRPEAFLNYVAAQAAPARPTDRVGIYDGLRVMKDGEWRATAPNEPLLGPKIDVGPDNLFIFKNNQCKPECCGSSFSCGGGCVCTTPEQREMINSRGGNRTAPDDGV
jgi:hypothetical protein